MPTFHATDGTRLYYEIEGTGAPLVLHLGAGCDLELWRAAGYVEPLAQLRACILFDHRGHGRSDHPPGATANHVDRYAADLVELLDHLELPRAAYWAYSNGIAVGLRAAEAHPERFERLVLSGTIGTAAPSQEQLAAAIASSLNEYRTNGWDPLISRFEAEEGAVPDWMKDRIRATPLEGVLGWTEARADWGWSSWDALPNVPCPGLFLVGELEDPDDGMLRAARRMPSATRVRIPGKGHITGFLDSSFVLPHVLAFLVGGPGTALA